MQYYIYDSWTPSLSIMMKMVTGYLWITLLNGTKLLIELNFISGVEVQEGSNNFD